MDSANANKRYNLDLPQLGNLVEGKDTHNMPISDANTGLPYIFECPECSRENVNEGSRFESLRRLPGDVLSGRAGMV